MTDNSGATATTTRSLTINSAYAQTVLATTGIRGYWRLADTGTTAADSSTSNNPGSYVNGPTDVSALITGEVNNARRFDGANDYVNLSPTPFGSPTTYSAEAWVRTAATAGSGKYNVLLSNSNFDFTNGFTLAVDSSNRPLFAVGGNFSNGRATSSVTIAPNTTHHLVGTYDGSRIRIYVDGVERANVVYNGDTNYANGRDIFLGRAFVTNFGFLNGTLDEAALYTGAMSAATVLAHYNAGKP